MFTFIKNLFFPKSTSISLSSISGNELKIYRGITDESVLLFSYYSVDYNRFTTIDINLHKARGFGELMKDNYNSHHDFAWGVLVSNDYGDTLQLKKDPTNSGREYFLYMTKRGNPSEETTVLLKRESIKKIYKFLLNL